MLSQKWGKISVDEFVSDKNNKYSRFNSKFLCPNTETVNVFSSDWSNESNTSPTHFSHSEKLLNIS